MAATASLLEAFKMPMTEVHARFCKSELVLMGWRSRETAYNMRVSMEKNKAQNAGQPVQNIASEQAVAALERRMGSVAKKAETPDGDIDLGRLTGPEMLHYMQSLGVRVGGRN